MTRQPEILTFGCRLNLSESATIRRHVLAAGQGDVAVVNTCAVTAEAERQAAQAIRRLARRQPALRIAVTGCAAEIAPDRYADLPGVHRVVGNAEKLLAATWGAPAAEATEPEIAGGLATRGLLQVQTGCDHRCTFCIIPYGRGPSRSVPVAEAVARARRLAEAGHREIVLTGVDLTAWGRDLPGAPRLGDLVEALLAALPGLPRLRLSSIDPAEIDPALWRALADEPRLMPHLHLSLQAGDDMVLKRMRRRHGAAEALSVIDRARRLRPDLAVGADLIAGFPTETETMFAATLRLVEQAGLAFTHVFPYSPRPGTPAARMPQVPEALRRERAARLRAAAERSAAAWLAGLVGTRATVLAERGGLARTEHFATVRLDPPLPPGTLAEADLLAVNGAALQGRLVQALAA